MPFRQDGFVKQDVVCSLHWSKKHDGSAFILPPCAAKSSKPSTAVNSSADLVACSAGSASAGCVGAAIRTENEAAAAAAAFGSHDGAEMAEREDVRELAARGVLRAWAVDASVSTVSRAVAIVIAEASSTRSRRALEWRVRRGRARARESCT